MYFSVNKLNIFKCFLAEINFSQNASVDCQFFYRVLITLKSTTFFTQCPQTCTQPGFMKKKKLFRNAYWRVKKLDNKYIFSLEKCLQSELKECTLYQAHDDFNPQPADPNLFIKYREVLTSTLHYFYQCVHWL